MARIGTASSLLCLNLWVVAICLSIFVVPLLRCCGSGFSALGTNPTALYCKFSTTAPAQELIADSHTEIVYLPASYLPDSSRMWKTIPIEPCLS